MAESEAESKPQALISVSDKTGIVDFAKTLLSIGFELIASSGTHKLLQQSGLTVTEVSEVTSFGELLDGRVKTLHPNIHAGILARNTQSDLRELKENGIQPISVVVCNLYPFKATISNSDCTLEKAIENIDIGGVTLLRAAAKNYARVTVICDPQDYGIVCEQVSLSLLVLHVFK
uniref:Bifunctional purine biosynthesis protein ATIC n=1 Tax=Syphacia muris TaxID=451379 RepID=A0A0N5AXZ9_9BILA